MELALTRSAAVVALATAIATGCATDPPTTIPDTTPGMTDPPADAMKPCPTAEREGTGDGYIPDVDTGTRAELAHAGSEAADYLATCDNRHQTLREHIQAHIDQQRSDGHPAE